MSEENTGQVLQLNTCDTPQEKLPLPTGPIEGVKYPLKVIYCGECSLPLEFCSLNRDPQKCKDWLEKNLPDMFEELHANDDGGESTAEPGEGKKRQTRGGRAIPKIKAKKAVDRCIGIARASRGKKKYVTVVTGLSTYDVDLKDAAKYFAGKFACGSSVTGPTK